MGGNSKYCVPEPFLCNCLKHHAGYVTEFVRRFSTRVFAGEGESGIKDGNNPIENGKMNRLKVLREELIIIGRSQMDFYIGNLSPGKITEEIIVYLSAIGLKGREEYLNRISRVHKSFMETILSDGSSWVLLPGKVPGRHIHIHPGRYSPLTLRVRSDTLKTAIAVLVYSGCTGKDPSDLRVINEARTGILDLPPVKDVSPRRGMGKMTGILREMLLRQTC